MGGQQSSESLVDNQSMTNRINNISNENCINACDSDISNLHMDIEDSDIEGNVSISSVCNILGASCVLKSSLSTSLHNTQKSKQSADAMQEQDPLSLLGSLFGGPSSSVDETTNQSVANRVSNIINSTCQNKSVQKLTGINVQMIGDKVGGNVNITADGGITNTECILNNISRTAITNDQSNSQSAKIMQGSPLLYAIIGLVIVAVIVMIGIVILGIGGVSAGVIAKDEMSKKSSKPGMKKPPSGPPPPYSAKPGMKKAPQTYRVR